MTKLAFDANNNLVTVSDTVDDISGTTGSLAVEIYTAVYETSLSKIENILLGNSSQIAAMLGISSAAALASASISVTPIGGRIAIPSAYAGGARSVAWAVGDTLYIAPDGKLGTLATLRLAGPPLWTGMSTAKAAKVIADGSGQWWLIVTYEIGTVI